MKSYIMEIPLSCVVEDEAYPDTDCRYIYEHLKHTLSHPSPFPLPAIIVKLLDGKVVVVSGHKYLRIAREQNRPWIRARLRSESNIPLDVHEVLDQLPTGTRITPNEVLEREGSIKVLRDYHVYFFENPLTPEARDRFLTDIAGFFENLNTDLIPRSKQRVLRSEFPFEGLCVEFEALIPIGDPSWMGPYLKICQKFSREVQRIVSFQGALFPEAET